MSDAMKWVIQRMDESAALNGPRLRDETFAYIQNHETDVADQLRDHQFASIPTSFGIVKLRLADLEAVL